MLIEYINQILEEDSVLISVSDKNWTETGGKRGHLLTSRSYKIGSGHD